MFELRGIGVSKGLAIGRAFWLRQGPVRSSKSSVVGDAEGQTLESIIIRTQTFLADMEQQTAKSIGKAESGLFSIYQMIIEDDYLLEKIQTFKQQGVGLRESIVKGFSAIIDEFRSLEDSYMNERANDFANLLQLILEVIDGENTPAPPEIPEGSVVVATEISPTDFLRLKEAKVAAIVSEKGGPNGHVAILSRSLGLPAILGVGESLSIVGSGQMVVVDADRDSIFVNPDKATLLMYRKQIEQDRDSSLTYQAELARLRDGTPYPLLGNASNEADIQLIHDYNLAGVGLFRTEYLYQGREELPTEEEQFQFYKQILLHSSGLPVTFRTFDIGGDKPIAGLAVGQEDNPFLGLRGIRLAFHYEDVFRTQLRALMRASIYGQMQIMFPFVSGVFELVRAKELLQKVVEELRAEGHRVDPVPLGTMIELPSAALVADSLMTECDFVSIGTNDLIQYTLGVDRTNAYVGDLYDSADPAVLQLIENVAAAGLRNGTPVGICGEMASAPRFTQWFIGIGITSLSVTPHMSSMIKRKLAELSIQGGRITDEKDHQ